MIVEILNIILLVLYFLSICNVIRTLFFMYDNNKKENQFNISDLGLWYLGLSISYIVSLPILGLLS